MTAAARNTRNSTANARNAAHQSIPRSTNLTASSSLKRPSPEASLSVRQESALNRAKHDFAMRSARSTAAHAARRKSEQAIFGRPATAAERRVAADRKLTH